MKYIPYMITGAKGGPYWIRWNPGADHTIGPITDGATMKMGPYTTLDGVVERVNEVAKNGDIIPMNTGLMVVATTALGAMNTVRCGGSIPTEAIDELMELLVVGLAGSDAHD